MMEMNFLRLLYECEWCLEADDGWFVRFSLISDADIGVFVVLGLANELSYVVGFYM